MAYTALVGLGSQIGVGITSVKLYQCGTNCTSCTPITNYTSVAVSSFNPTLLVTGITDGSTCIKAEPVGVCSGSTQCIIVSGIPGPTPSPTVPPATPAATQAATPLPTAGTTPLPTPTATTPGPTATVTVPAATPTPTATALPGCGSIVTGTYTGSTLYNYDDRQLAFPGVANGSTISFTCNANDRPNNISIRTSSTVITSTGWFGDSSGYNSGDYWYPTVGTGPITLTITYDNTKTYYIDTIAAPALTVPYEVNDYWEVNISCSGAPGPTPTATQNYYNVKVRLIGKQGTNGNLTVYQSSDGITFTNSLTITSTDNDSAQQFFNGTPGYYYYFIVARTSGTSNRLNWYTQVAPSDFNPGAINGAGCSEFNGATLQSDTFRLPTPIQSVTEVLLYGDISDACL
jgi:hypothetical protein